MSENQNSISFKIIKELRSCGHFLHYKICAIAGRRRILLSLYEHSELLQRELQDILKIKSGSLSEIIINMEAEGLVKKTKDEKDGRQFVLKLTPEGVRQAEILQKEYYKQVEKITGCLSEEQKYELYHLLKIITNNWEKLKDFPKETTDKNQVNSD